MLQPLMPKKLKLTGSMKIYAQDLLELTSKRCPFHHRRLECQSRKSRDTWSKRQVWPWSDNEAGQRLTEFSQDNTHHFPDKGPYSQSYGFSNNHVQMWQLNHKEGWVPKNWCFRIVVLGNTLESLLDIKDIKPVNPKGNRSWIFFERTDAEAPIL